MEHFRYSRIQLYARREGWKSKFNTQSPFNLKKHSIYRQMKKTIRKTSTRSGKPEWKPATRNFPRWKMKTDPSTVRSDSIFAHTTHGRILEFYGPGITDVRFVKFELSRYENVFSFVRITLNTMGRIVFARFHPVLYNNMSIILLRCCYIVIWGIWSDLVEKIHGDFRRHCDEKSVCLYMKI